MRLQYLPKAVQNTIDAFASLPGIGPKSASRLTFYLLRGNQLQAKKISAALDQLWENIVYCDICYNIAETSPCQICASEQRDKHIICVTSEALDVVAIEKSGAFTGQYHVLHGEISPVNGVGASDIKITELVERIKKTIPLVEEVILATNPTMEGETTALYIAKLLSELPVKISRIARGLPVGGDLEYADQVTLSNALTHRRSFEV